MVSHDSESRVRPRSAMSVLSFPEHPRRSRKGSRRGELGPSHPHPPVRRCRVGRLPLCSLRRSHEVSVAQLRPWVYGVKMCERSLVRSVLTLLTHAHVSACLTARPLHTACASQQRGEVWQYGRPTPLTRGGSPSSGRLLIPLFVVEKTRWCGSPPTSVDAAISRPLPPLLWRLSPHEQSLCTPGLLRRRFTSRSF